MPVSLVSVSTSSRTKTRSRNSPHKRDDVLETTKADLIVLQLEPENTFSNFLSIAIAITISVDVDVGLGCGLNDYEVSSMFVISYAMTQTCDADECTRLH